MSSIISYIWKNRLLAGNRAKGTKGETIEVMNPGTADEQAPHIFRNAKLCIDGITWSGDVMVGDDMELQIPENLILHILENKQQKSLALPIHDVNTLCIEIPSDLKQEFTCAEKHIRKFPCEEAISELPGIVMRSAMSRLLAERLEEKSRLVERIFRQSEQRWDDTLLKTTIRSFGFGIQSNVFDEWGSILNTQALGKHSDNPIQVEAIFFGQAGLLEDESIPYYYREEAKKSKYYNELKSEYRFLQNKFNLKTLDYKEWGNGNTTPHLRIARLATLYCTKRITVSEILSKQTLTDIYGLFNSPLHGYWSNHTCFGGTETAGNGNMKQRQIDVLVINSIIPFLHIYGRHRREAELCERAEDFLYHIECEENSIIKRWRQHGITAECAADSQALLQLTKSYCNTINCTNCPFAYHYIKSKIQG